MSLSFRFLYIGEENYYGEQTEIFKRGEFTGVDSHRIWIYNDSYLSWFHDLRSPLTTKNTYRSKIVHNI